MPTRKESKKAEEGAPSLEDLSKRELLRSIRADLAKKRAPEPLAEPQPPEEEEETD